MYKNFSLSVTSDLIWQSGNDLVSLLLVFLLANTVDRPSFILLKLWLPIVDFMKWEIWKAEIIINQERKMKVSTSSCNCYTCTDANETIEMLTYTQHLKLLACKMFCLLIKWSNVLFGDDNSVVREQEAHHKYDSQITSNRKKCETRLYIWIIRSSKRQTSAQSHSNEILLQFAGGCPELIEMI